MDFDKQFWYEEMEHTFTKADPRLTEDVETATQYLQNERGHPEENARQLAEFLHRDDGGSHDDLAGDDTDEAAAFDDRDPFLYA